MKKILFAAIIAGCAFTANAQDKMIRFGAKAGVNVANLTGDIEDTKTKIGFHVGALAEFNFTEHLALQPEVLYSLQGAKEEFTDSGADFEGNYKLSYINVPVIFKYNNLGTKGLSLGVGPQVGFLMSAKYELEGSFMGETESEEVDVKDQTKSVDFGLVFNAEYELDFGLFFQARYNLGLSNLNDTDSSDDYSFKNSVIAISAGYKF